MMREAGENVRYVEVNMPSQSKVYVKFYSLHELLLELIRRKWDKSREGRMRELAELYKFKSPLVMDFKRPLPGLGDWLSAGSRRWLMMCWEARTCL